MMEPTGAQPGISAAAIVERVVIAGDLGALRPEERVAYYARLCESLGLNPLTKPFEYIRLDGKLTLYARKDAAEQLRRINAVSIDGLAYPTPPQEDLLVVVASGHDRHGRTDSASGVVSIAGLSGDRLANAYMRAETKAKRRLTLSLCGLGFPDESELETIATAEPTVVGEDGVEHRPTLADKVAAKVAAIEAPKSTESTERREVVHPDGTPVFVGRADQVAEREKPQKSESREEAFAEATTDAVVLTATPLPGMTMDEFSEAVTGVPVELVRAVRTELYPDAKKWGDLSRVQLAEVATKAIAVHADIPKPVALAEPTGPNIPAEVPLEATSDDQPDPVVAETPDESACDSASPFTGVVCDLPKGHKGAHRSGEDESW